MRIGKVLCGIILVMMLLSGCTGGETPSETVSPAATAAPTATTAPTTTPSATTAAPTTTSPPATTAPPEEPAVDLNDPSVQIGKIIPEGGSIGTFQEIEYKNLNFPPAKYSEVSASAYKVTYPDFEIYVLKSQNEASSRNFYDATVEQIRSKEDIIKPYPSSRTIYVGEKSLAIQHRLTNQGFYLATLTQKGLYTFYLDFKTESDAEDYLKENMDYLFE